jgi:DNA-binding transcriptional LysR family regulator
VDVEQMVVNEARDPLVWIRSKDFVLSPGAPIPILTWPGDDWMIRTLTKHGLSYKIVFNSPDYHAKLAAVEAGIGLTAIPESMVPSHLVRAREYYLPELPPLRAVLCVRLGLETDATSALVKRLSALFFKSPRALLATALT